MAALSGDENKAAYLIDSIGMSVTLKDSFGRSVFDIAQGKCFLYLKDRNRKGFVTGSVVDKSKKKR